MSFYKYSTLAGRLIRSSQSAAFRPQGLSPLIEDSAATTFRFSSADVKTVKSEEIKIGEHLGTLAHGDFTGTKFKPAGDVFGVPGTRGVVPNTRSYKKLMKFQEEWAKHTDKFVWELRGTSDKIINYTVVSMALACIPLSAFLLYEMMFPDEN